MSYRIELVEDRVRVHLDGDEYCTCVRNAGRMALGSKRGGFLNSSADPLQSKRYGQLAEMAYARWRGLEYTFEVMCRGDAGIDYRQNCRTVDVKTSSPGREVCLVKWLGDRGAVHALADIFVCGHIISENTTDGEAVVEFIGWATRDDVLAMTIEPAAWHDEEKDPQGNFNRVVRHADLRGLDGLDEEVGPIVDLPPPTSREIIQEGPWAGIVV